ncbi:MAG: hypothetical protein IPL49_07905 [Saprospirales bacterium]|nr:hypothetical protein [Saprospirales bacterium]MBK8490807.1 hypothetical protein [Saprospirales bacterium]
MFQFSYGKWILVSLWVWGGFLATQAQSLPDWAAGAWRVSSSSDAFTGEVVRFERDSFTLFFNVAGTDDNPFQIEPTTCPEPLYESDWEDSETFFLTNQRNFDDLTGFQSDSIPVLRIYCVAPKTGAQVYFVKKNHLLLTYLGLVCHLKPKRRCLFFR